VALGQSPPDPDLIYLAMQDKLHQPYRQTLIPGLTDIVQYMTPSTQPGLLGVCLSGAGPTILALATDKFEEIAESIISRFRSHNIQCSWQLLEPAEGSHVLRK
jgi:homoserine kinase